jgi:hypothetical protein
MSNRDSWFNNFVNRGPDARIYGLAGYTIFDLSIMYEWIVNMNKV